MGIDRLTALTIANNADIMEVFTYGPPNEKGKYGGMICWKYHPHHPGMPLLSAACTYDSPEMAKAALETVIEQLKAEFT